MAGTNCISGNLSLMDFEMSERTEGLLNHAISYVDICNIIVNLIIIFLMLLLIFRCHSKLSELFPHNQQHTSTIGNKNDRKITKIHYTIKTILLLTLLFMWSLTIGEALIRWFYSTVSLSPSMIVSPVVSFMTVLSIISFYNSIETSACDSFVITVTIPLVLWIVQIILVSAKVYKGLFALCVGVASVSTSLCVSIVLVLCLLLVHDVILCITKIQSHCKLKAEASNNEPHTLRFLSKSCLKSKTKTPDTDPNFGESYPKLLRPSDELTVTFQPPEVLVSEVAIPAEGGGASSGTSRLRYRHDKSSFLSRCSFWWYVKILRLGWKRPLEYADLDRVPENESSQNQYQKFNEAFLAASKCSPQVPPSLWRVYFTCYWRALLLGGLLKLLGDGVNIVGPLAISPIVNFVRDIQEGSLILEGEFRSGEYFIAWPEFIRNGWILAWLALIASLLQSTFSQASSHILATEGIHVRSSLQAMVYSKSLRRADYLKNEEEGVEHSHGQNNDTARIINLATEDADNILSFFLHCHYIWAIPLKVAALVAILWLQLGVSAIYSSIIAVLFLIPVQFLLAKCISSVNKIFVEASDDRLRKTHEMLSFIRTIKVNVWQNIFLKNIFGAREIELRLLLKDSLLRACMTFLTQASGIVIILLAFGFYAMIHEQPPDEGTVFSSLALFSQLTVPLFILPLVVAYTIKAKRSTVRLEKYLSETEVKSSRKGYQEHNEIEGKPGSSATSDLNGDPLKSICQEDNVNNHVDHTKEKGKNVDDSAIACIVNGCYQLRSESRDYVVLENINLSIPKGKLTMVVGNVGSGKTSLLLALLEEIPQISGDYYWNGGSSVALVSQTPWLLNCSLRENILFFKGFNRQRYERVLKACALTPDITILPNGDETEIGERGINLSGGQRQRVAIARALYSDVPVVVMDCPFSALDTTVSYHVFQEGILEFLLKTGNTTVVISTQHEHLCQYADKIVYLRDKNILFQGTPKEISSQYPKLWSRWNSPAVSSPVATSPSVTNIWKERNTLKRHVSKMNVQYSASRRSLNGSMLEEDINETFLRTLPLRSKPSFARSSPFHTVLPADEMDGLHTRTLSRKKKLRPSKPPIYRTTSSTPAFCRTEDDVLLREKSVFGRQAAKSLSRPRRHKSLPCDERRRNTRVAKREPSVLRKFFGSKHLKATEPQKKLSRTSTRHSRWSIKRFLSTEEKTEETEEDPEGGDVTEESDDELYEALIDEEERERGRISKKNYLAYLQACGLGLGLLYLLFSVLNQGVSIALDLWLGHWSSGYNESNKNRIDSNCESYIQNKSEVPLFYDDNYEDIISVNSTETCPDNKNQVNHYLQIFALLSGLAVMAGFLTICLAQVAAHRGRRILHQKMLSAVVGSHVKFFDETPLGRILNRFSSDTSMIDKELGWSIMHLVFFALLCGSAVLVNAIISPVFVIVTIPICLIYYTVQHVFRSTSRELKRLESLSRSPILGLITETANSPTAIRAYGAEDKFFSSYFRRLDSYLSSSILLHVGNRWLGISLDYMGSIIVFLSMVACLVGSTINVGNFLTPATVGLAIKYTLTIPVYLNWLVRFLSDTEMCLNSVERVRQYSSLHQELPATSVKDKITERKSYQRMHCPVKKCRCRLVWLKKSSRSVAQNGNNHDSNIDPDVFPASSSGDSQEGRIEFREVNLCYDRTCEPIVSNLSFTIQPGQKVGLCGRTGSGKSSVIQGILGMVDYHEGTILLNGIDTDTIPLDELRKSVSIILQENCLFKGTVRFHIDPENSFNDDLIWAALESVFLKDFVASLPNKLYTEIGSGNISLSSGQVQLLTLSRVLLMKKPIVFLDEITSNLDTQLEKDIFDMLKTELPHSTILFVTHSVPCLLESDKVLVLQKGELVEEGTPQELLKNKRGRFSALLQSINKYS